MQLYINSYGAYIHVKDQMFEIKIPAKIEKNENSTRIDSGENENSTRIDSGGNENNTRDLSGVNKKLISAKKVSAIVLNNSGALSTDAVRLALRNNIDIIFSDSYGKPMGRVWHSKLGSTTLIRKKQLEASMSKTGLDAVKGWVVRKLENQTSFVKWLKKHREKHAIYLDNKIEKLENLAISVAGIEGDNVEAVADLIRGREGTGGRLFFETMSYVLPKEHQFSGRSHRPAKDAFNAFLNYAYGILYGKVEKGLIIAGLDPYLGFLHRDDYNQLSFVFDFIEPYRLFADTVVFKLFSGKMVNKNHTDIIRNGVKLNQAGKELLIPAFNDYFDDTTVRYNGRNISRSNIIQFDAHNFANKLIERDKDFKIVEC